ncbi:hypothetical protein BKP35_17325 [Anaerobacillus arseniciselenatis]|uniref:Ferrous iron transporter FeoA-like domain-containing protein n=1 Tax=Anaerobacillus arseniciselenatis TaxID=85682 RepID=A0A1S2L970_9BACI|nr:FeoA family protein [Anaerobacillus arseniciselenatis]OIJ08864.1 hypothetical protein BKP35_17325 [Anaerobacillus arseniciselenatis]
MNANVGQTVIIKDLSKANSLIRRRLLDLGIVEEATVMVANKMPFGGPILIEYKSNRIAIRKVDAQKIVVGWHG